MCRRGWGWHAISSFAFFFFLFLGYVEGRRLDGMVWYGVWVCLRLRAEEGGVHAKLKKNFSFSFLSFLGKWWRGVSGMIG